MIVWVQLRANCALDSDRMARPQEEEKARSLESMKEKKKKKSPVAKHSRRKATIISHKLLTNLKDRLMCERCHPW